jgi:hypothetical protein
VFGTEQIPGQAGFRASSHYEPTQTDLEAALRRGWDRAIEAAAQWHDERGVAPRGPEYGMAAEDDRRAMRVHARFHCECAFAIRTLEPPK